MESVLYVVVCGKLVQTRPWMYFIECGIDFCLIFPKSDQRSGCQFQRSKGRNEEEGGCCEGGKAYSRAIARQARVVTETHRKHMKPLATSFYITNSN